MLRRPGLLSAGRTEWSRVRVGHRGVGPGWAGLGEARVGVGQKGPAGTGQGFQCPFLGLIQPRCQTSPNLVIY